MLTTLYRLFDKFKYTPLHPQWIANRSHLRKLELLSTHAGSGRYVDIGSGNEDIAPRLGGVELVTMDYPLTSQAYAAQPDIYADVQCLPLADESVDGVVFFEVLEHVRSDELAVREISRVLKENGVLFISAPFLYPLHDAPHDYKRFSHYGLSSLLSHNGMEVREVQLHGNSFTTAIQLANLAVVESVKVVAERSQLVAFVMLLPAYLLCLAGNLVALPLTGLSRPSALILGQTLVARKLPLRTG